MTPRDIARERQSPTPERIGVRRSTLSELVEEAGADDLAHLEQQLGVEFVGLGPGTDIWARPVLGQYGPITGCTWSWAPRRGRPPLERIHVNLSLDPELVEAARGVLAEGETLSGLVGELLGAEAARRGGA